MDLMRSPGDVPTLAVPDSDDDEAPVAGPTLGTGTRVGRYEIQGILGEGGMGVVYDAYDPKLQRPIALKVLPTRHRGSTDGAPR